MHALALALSLALGQWGPDSIDSTPTNAVTSTFVWTPATPAASSVDAYTLALWHMDETDGGPPVDSAGYDGGIVTSVYYGTVQAGVGVYSGDRFFPGNASGSVSGHCFSGGAPYATVTALRDGEYTVSAWLQRTTQPSAQTGSDVLVISDGPINFRPVMGFNLTDATGIVNLYWGTGAGTYATGSTATALAANSGWHHLAAVVTVTGGGTTRTVKWYIDGALDNTTTSLAAPSLATTVQTAYLGCSENGYWAWAGAMDDLLIQSRALTAAEVLALYRQSGRWSSPPPSTVGPSLALSRASTATYETAAGHIVNALSGELRCGYLGCLSEPSRTNQALRNTEFGHAAWGKYGVGASAPSVSADAAASPDGTWSADQITWPSGLTVGQASFLEPATGLTVTTGQDYTWSVWLRTASGTASVYLNFDNATAPVQPTLATATTTWTRFSITRNIGAGDLGTGSKLYPAIGIDRRGGAESDQGGPVLLVWGAQLEQGSHATSVLLTAGTSVTRSSDVLSVSSSGLIGASGGIYLGVTPEWASASAPTLKLISSNAAGEADLSLSSGVLTWSAHAGTVTSASLGWSASTAHTVSARWTASAASLVTDSTLVTGTGGTPSISTLYLGGSSTVGAGVAISRVKVCKGRGCP